MQQDIRWQQRFSNYKKALLKLSEGVSLINKRFEEHEESLDGIDEMLKEGLIQRFEFTHELAWNLMKDYAEYQGNNLIGGSIDATREAFKLNLIQNGEGWMDMIVSRNKISHTYNEAIAEEIFEKIISLYHQLFLALETKMETIKSAQQDASL